MPLYVGLLDEMLCRSELLCVRRRRGQLQKSNCFSKLSFIDDLPTNDKPMNECILSLSHVIHKCCGLQAPVLLKQ